MPLPEPPFHSEDERDEREPLHDDAAESFAGKDLDELQDEFEDEEPRQSER